MGVQVQTATKDGQGNPLSILNRQFISFSYGGKNIEDFDLLAVFSGDRLSKEIYAPFNDTTTEQTELDGQMFWRSNFKAGQLNFTLSTDGISAEQLEDFKNWFQPGIEKALILSEHSNRAILARVSAPPQMSLLPFEKDIEVNIGGETISTKTSLYKGDINLSFVMDDPYWYSIKGIFDESFYENLPDKKKEMAKIIYEDGTPFVSMIDGECFFADGKYSKLGEDGYKIENDGFNLKEEDSITSYLYYCGTAPVRPEISFEMVPIVDSTTKKISFYKKGLESDYYLRIGPYIQNNDKKNILYFSLPSILYSYNQILDILDKYPNGKSVLDFRKEIRDNVYNYYSRSYAIYLIDQARNDTNREHVELGGEIKESFRAYFLEEMGKFFDGNLSCSINCKTGVVTSSIKILDYFAEETSYETITENAGDMVKSNYLIIDTRTLPTGGKIRTNDCLEVKTNTNLLNLKIKYNYMYL